MLYMEYILKAFEKVIQQTDNGLYFLVPTWRNILKDNELDVNNISDMNTDLNEIEDVLKLEVERRNKETDNSKYVIDWIFETIATVVEPEILNEQTDYVKAVTDFIKANHNKNIE